MNNYPGGDTLYDTPGERTESVIIKKPSLSEVINTIEKLKYQSLPVIDTAQSTILPLPLQAKKDQVYFKLADEMEAILWQDITSRLGEATCCILFERNGYSRKNIEYIRKKINERFDEVSKCGGNPDTQKNLFTEALKTASMNLGLFLSKVHTTEDLGSPLRSDTPAVLGWKEVQEAGEWLITLGDNLIKICNEAFKNDLSDNEKALAANLHFKYGEKFGKAILNTWEKEITEHYGASGPIMTVVDTEGVSDLIAEYLSPADVGYASMLGKGRNTLHHTLKDYENPEKAYKLVLIRIISFVIQLRQSICQLHSHFSRLKPNDHSKNRSIVKKQAFRMTCVLSEMLFLYRILTTRLPAV